MNQNVDVGAADRGSGGLASEKLRTELRLLAEMNIPYTAELALQATNPTYGSKASEPVEADRATADAAGAVVGGRALLVDDDGADARIDRLREALSSEASLSADGAQELVELWIGTEPLLTGEEIGELMPSMIARAFGATTTPIRPSRGDEAQGGGE